MPKFYYTYVLLSQVDNNLYVGWTANLIKRLKAHNLGEVSSTSSRRPFSLIYYEACLKKELAIAREKVLKSGFGRVYINKRTGR